MDASATAIFVFTSFGLIYTAVALYLAKKSEQQ